MNTSSILSQVGRHITLDETETQYFTSLLIPRKLKQGEFLEESGELSKFMVHVHSGCLMTYYTDKEGVDHVVQFSTAGWWTGDLQSQTKKTPSIFSTRALADSEVFLLPTNSMEQLLEKNMKFERYFRIIFQNSLVTHSFRILQGISATAEERYLYFREKYPSLEQYVPLKYIASYLGMTPEFLSKIRRKLMNHKS